jgi:hypothetical protein
VWAEGTTTVVLVVVLADAVVVVDPVVEHVGRVIVLSSRLT